MTFNKPRRIPIEAGNLIGHWILVRSNLRELVRAATSLVVVIVVLSGLPGASSAEVEAGSGIHLTLSGPTSPRHGIAQSYRATLTSRNGAWVNLDVVGSHSDSSILPLSGQTIDLLVDGELASSGTTDGSGHYAVNLTLVGLGTHMIEAVAYRDTPLEVKTPPMETLVLESPSTAISAGAGHTCAVESDRTARCWGANDSGQLGDGTNTNRNTHAPVTGLSDATQISAGGRHTCAVISDGTVRCWGDNAYGQLGDGTNTSRKSPITVAGLSDVIAISAGRNQTCGVISDGTVRCWGDNAFTGLSDVTAVSAGGDHTCAVISDGTVRCWGYNTYGQLGDGTNWWGRRSPSTVTGLSDVTAISAGETHTCALISDGTVHCWGYNAYGQLGDGTNTSRNSPVAVAGLSDVTAISLGYEHTCALTSNGRASCWGATKDGRLGSGSCSLVADGPARCLNQDHTAGVTHYWYRNKPSSVGVSDITAISAGGRHTCVLIATSASDCWGINDSGQLSEHGVSRYSQLAEVAIEDPEGIETPCPCLIPLGTDPLSGQGVLGSSAPTGVSEGDVYSIDTVPGQLVGVTLYYTPSAQNQDVDLFVFKGDGPSFSQHVAKSTRASGLTDTLSIVAQGGTYSIVALGWLVAVEQPYILWTNVAKTFTGDDYYLSTYGTGTDLL